MKKLFLLIPALVISMMMSATVPSTDFAAPGYSCSADDAVLSGAPANKFALIESETPHYLGWNDVSTSDYSAVATWTINATRACYVSVSLDLGPVYTPGSSNKHIFEVKILDANNNPMGTLAEPAENADANQVKALDGKILIPAAGNYTIELRNNRNFGKGSIKNVILTYLADAPVTDFAAPGYYCSADDATLSTGVYGLSLYTESEPHYINCNEATYDVLLAKWTVVATRACYVTVGLDFGPEVGSNKHIFEVKILDKDGNPIGTLAEGDHDPDAATANNIEHDQIKTLDGSVVIPAKGVYNVELRSIRAHGKGSIKNIILTYDGDAPITDFAAPGYTFLAKHATLDGNIEYNTTTATPYIRYTDNSEPGTASWAVHATRACQVKVAMNMVDNSAYTSGNGKHRFIVELLQGNEVKSSVEEPSEVDENGRTFPRSYDMPGFITIPAEGDYTIRVRNPRAHSRCGLASVTLTYSYEGGNTVNIPVATIPFEDALLHNGATRDLTSVPQQIHFGSVSAYAEWNIHAIDGVYSFTYTVVGSDYGKYNLIIKDAQNNTLYDEYKGLQNSGSVTHSNIVLVAGDYTIEVANVNSGSVGYITNIAATTAEGYFILNDNKADDGSIAAANYDESNTKYNVLLKRSFTAGRYYTLCVPFDSYDSQLASKFGTGYEVWKMASAEQVGEEINLNFEQIAGDDFAAGVPYLIKPTIDVENPVFSDKKIRNYTSNNVKSCTAADFIGTFYKSEIPAGENNLYLQNNNLYYNESDATPIKGTRAWIRLKPQGGANNVKAARIVLGGKVATEISLVNGELVDGTVKTIENGQLVIIRDGVRYNVMGVKIQ